MQRVRLSSGAGPKWAWLLDLSEPRNFVRMCKALKLYSFFKFEMSPKPLPGYPHDQKN